VSEVQRILAGSDEPLTLSKIRAQLPASFRTVELNELADLLQHQVAAHVLYQYPKYRSPQDRFWDRDMPVHIAHLMRAALADGPLAWAALRRKLPAYAQIQAQVVFEEQLNRGLLHRYPRVNGRSAERFGLRPPDPKDYLRQELPELFTRLAALGFTRPQVRLAAIELLHEEEWDVAPPEETPPESSPEPQTPAARLQPTVSPAETMPAPPVSETQPVSSQPAQQPAPSQAETNSPGPDVSQLP
jgi:hypothetical protein